MPERGAELRRLLALQPHPEGGWYREAFRSALQVSPLDDRPRRAALSSIDFLLESGQHSAWHRVRSDEVWHLLEGEALTLWLMPPDHARVEAIRLSRATRLRHAVPAGWWQAAEAQGAYAYCGATVGPGFEFDDFAFGRHDAEVRAALRRLDPGLLRLL